MYVKSAALHQLRCFEKLNLDFARPDGSFAGWTVFVGGNASGKSSLLKGIALALVGPDAGRQLIGPALGWIRREGKRADAELDLEWDQRQDHFKKGGKLPSASFRCGVRWAMEGRDPAVAQFRGIERRNTRGTRIQTPDRGPWSATPEGWFSAGYGPMRRLSGSSSESIAFSVRGGVVSRYVTLFREDAALSESEAWLKLTQSRYLESRAQRSTQESSLKRLLDGVSRLLGNGLLPHGMTISRITVDHVYVKDEHGLELPMRDISDGCRSIYATVLDLVHGMYEVYGIEGLFEEEDKSVVISRPGVVLIDEIEAHLHPEWQRTIPAWLKEHFPKVQFLVTTHSPLVAQAADANGVFVLPSPSDSTRVARRLDPDETVRLRLGRAEKTLLGTAFGLKTSRSVWANAQIARWKVLNAKRKSSARLSKRERDEHASLAKQMALAFEQTDVDRAD
jgi:hypothetical protein